MTYGMKKNPLIEDETEITFGGQRVGSINESMARRIVNLLNLHQVPFSPAVSAIPPRELRIELDPEYAAALAEGRSAELSPWGGSL